MSESTISRRDFLKASGALIASVAATGAGDTPAQPAPSTLPTVVLNLNHATLRPGDTLRIGLTVRNTGPLRTADFYLGVVLPDGMTVFFVTSLSPLNAVGTRFDANPATFQPLFANIPVSQNLDITRTDFFAFSFSQSLPLGDYVFIAVLTPPGAFNDGRIDGGDLLAIDTKPLNFAGITADVATGCVEGHLLRSASGAITVGGSGATGVPLAQATVNVRYLTSLSSVVTDSAGHFLLCSVPPGLRQLDIQGAGQTAQVPVTVIAGARVSIDQPLVSRQQALNSVQSRLIAPAPPFRYVLVPQNPIPGGVVLGQGLGNNAVPPLTLASPQWLAYVDDHSEVDLLRLPNSPASLHIFLVDAQTAAVTDRGVTAWPMLNGVNYYGNADDNAASQDLVVGPQARTAVASAAQASARARQTFPRLGLDAAASGQTLALFIGGYEGQAVNHDLDTMVDLLANGRLPGASPLGTYSVFHAEASRTPKADVKTLFENICQASKPNDTLFIYFSGHGTFGGMFLNATNRDGSGVIEEADSLGAGDFDFSGCKACRVFIIIDSCYSGSFTNNGTVSGFPGLEKPGRNIVVMTATRAEREAYRYNGIQATVSTVLGGPGLVGGQFTNALVQSIGDLPFESDPWQALVDAYPRVQLKVNGGLGIDLQFFRQPLPTIFSRKVPGSCIPPPTFTFTPTSGGPGTRVTITGQNLGGTNAIVTFNGVQASVEPGGTDQILHVTVPTGATNGPITVTNNCPDTGLGCAAPTTSSAIFSTTELAVQLAHVLGTHAVGETIALRRITGGHVANAEAGCNSQHYHGFGIIIDQGTAVQQGGSQQDPDPTGCGYGRIVSIPIE